MKLIKKLIITIFCLIFLFSFSVSAENTPNITLSRVNAMPDETVTIDISISNNPGIMGMSFCITYNSEYFEYIDYTKGYLTTHNIKDYPEKGQIAFVNDEDSDKNNNGIILSVKFKIKDNAAPGRHTITIANQNREKYGNKLHNSFSNSKLEFIVPTVTPGYITVGETCENSGHKYGGWQIVTPADCTNTGVKTHTCIRCDFAEEAEMPITHNFEEDWTVDKIATPTEDGVMSRHCKNCDAVTDKITFAYEEVEDSQNPDDDSTPDNSANDNVTSNNESITNNSTNNFIDNTLGAKNPLSAVENIKDYQDNILPNTENNISTESSIENSTDSNNQSSQQNQNDDDVDNDDVVNTKNNKLSTTEIIVLILSSLVSVGIIIFAIILIMKRKKEN